MGFKKVIKRIVALGTGASMVGATIFGAYAADLADYPSQFIQDGKFTGVLVVGDKAAAEDVIGVSDIAVSLQFAATKPVSVTEGGTVTAEGDAWKVGTSTKILEMSETFVETLRNITTFIDDAELDALAGGTVTSSKGDAPYEQFLYLLGPGAGSALTSGYVLYVEDDEDVTADFLYFRSGDEIGRYLLEFTTALESDVDDSAGTQTTSGLYLTDIEDTTWTMFGKSYTVVQARRTSTSTTGGNNIKLILMGGAIKDTMLEGNTKTYTIDGTDYEVTLDFVDADSTKLTINGEGTRDMLDGDTDKMSDGITIGISEILYQNYAGGVHSVTFFLGAQKVELKDTNIDDVDQTSGLKVDDETIDGAFVVIEGTNDNSTFKINRVHINMTADDDFYVPAGGKLSENPELDEPQVLFTSNWDIEYRGLAEQPTETIQVQTSGNKKYKLKFMDGNGDEVSLPIAEAVAASSPVFGEKNKQLIIQENRTITKNDYFVLTDVTENRGERKTFAMQYKGGDKVTADSPVLKFKNLGSGDTTDQTYKNVSQGTPVGPAGGGVTELATLKIGGTDHIVYGVAGIKANDPDIIIDLDSSGAVTNTNVTITTWYGMEIDVTNASQRDPGSASVNDGTVIIFKTPDNSRDGASTRDNVESLQATDFVINITADSNTKVTFGTLSDHTVGQAGTSLSTITPDGETNVAYAYTSYGAFITHETPASEPATLKIEYPKAQREAIVYITAGATSFTQTAATTSTEAVTVQRIDVGATKLASEVPNINAVNSILVGGPCANAAAAEVMGSSPADCTEGFEPGVGILQVWDVGSGNVAMLVAGYNAVDTRNAAAVVANHGDYTFTGDKMEVTKVGSTLTVAVPVMEETTTEETTEETTTTE